MPKKERVFPKFSVSAQMAVIIKWAVVAMPAGLILAVLMMLAVKMGDDKCTRLNPNNLQQLQSTSPIPFTAA